MTNIQKDLKKQNILHLINNITDDEDLRQDLWVCHLSGTPTNDLWKSLEKLQARHEFEQQFKLAIHTIIKYPLPDQLLDIIKRFSDTERAIIFLVALGCSEYDISRYKGISQVRVRHIMYTICGSKRWEKMNGIKATLHR